MFQNSRWKLLSRIFFATTIPFLKNQYMSCWWILDMSQYLSCHCVGHKLTETLWANQTRNSFDKRLNVIQKPNLLDAYFAEMDTFHPCDQFHVDLISGCSENLSCRKKTSMRWDDQALEALEALRPPQPIRSSEFHLPKTSKSTRGEFELDAGRPKYTSVRAVLESIDLRVTERSKTWAVMVIAFLFLFVN